MKIEQKHFDAMMNETKCKLWNSERTPITIILDMIDGRNKFNRPFFAANGIWYTNCKPIKTETYVREWVEIVNQHIKDGYHPDKDGDFICGDNVIWCTIMWGTCGMKYSDALELVEGVSSYRPEWLEEREI